MRIGFYSKIAWDGIRKNRQLTLPYILTGAVMVMMYYILSALTVSPSISGIKGGAILRSILPLGCYMIAIFSVMFLFYSHSFLIRQRYREFGLYNVLGMDKRNISKVMVWESVYIAGFALALGLLVGIILSKAAELVLCNLLRLAVTFDFSISLEAIPQTVLMYSCIYLLLLCTSIIRIHRFRPLELIKSSRVGERIPKGTPLFALVGMALLSFAYYLALSIKEPITALAAFFAAVLLVIFATYLLFIAGSVTFCRMLQKNKRYYYKPNHFFSVASMIYRMKRNGAGLASICILLTMVLVMISSTTCLYFGSEDSIKNRCPYGINIDMLFSDASGIQEQNLSPLRDCIKPYSEGAELTGIRSAQIPGLFTDNGILIDVDNAANFTNFSYDDVGYLIVFSLEDYNIKTGQAVTLADDECMLHTERIKTRWDSFTMEFAGTYKVSKHLKESPIPKKFDSMIVPTVCLVVKDIEAFFAPIKDMRNPAGEPMMIYQWSVGFDIAEIEKERETANAVYDALNAFHIDYPGRPYSMSVANQQEKREDFYDMYGSLFFLGIMLSIVFLLAAVLIIYYKQISEGYEDQTAFATMQKVGMSKKAIRQSINSQMLTVFFTPLLFAGLHLSFAFPFITKIFRMFAFDNTTLSIAVNLLCFAAFGLFYTLVYKITSGIYFDIVSGKKE